MSFAIRSGLLPKRKGSRTFSYDNHTFEEDRAPKSAFRPSRRQIIPVDRDSVMNGLNNINHRDSILTTLSQRIDKHKDPNFAWID